MRNYVVQASSGRKLAALATLEISFLSHLLQLEDVGCCGLPVVVVERAVLRKHVVQAIFSVAPAALVLLLEIAWIRTRIIIQDLAKGRAESWEGGA